MVVVLGWVVFNYIVVELVVEGFVRLGGMVMLVIYMWFELGWYGYWFNLGDVGFGMVLYWMLLLGV